mgnify:CR=1 FL=1
MVIRYAKYQFTIKALASLILPPYKGSTFRGGFGNAFKKVVCALKRIDCKDCLLKTRCIYAYIFETSPPPSENSNNNGFLKINKYEKIPHPFIIEPPDYPKKEFLPNEYMSFNLILIGKANDYLPYFIYTFKELGKIGIGKGSGKYELVMVQAISNGLKQTVYLSKDETIKPVSANELNIKETFNFTEEKNETITINFLTPTRISYKRDLVVKPEFYILITTLLRRLGLLYYFHCENNNPAWNHKKLIEKAKEVTIVNNSLKWYDWQRYSTRQQTTMKLGGLIGEITYRGNIKPYLSILKAGEILHIGKGTSFGLGKFILKYF